MATTYQTGDWHFVPSLEPSNASDHLEALSSCLEAAGWTIVQSSDATTVTPSVRLSLADWTNTDAWEHWRDPDGNRDLTIQYGGTTNARAFHGRSGNAFTGGSPTTLPAEPGTAAGDGQIAGVGGSYGSGILDANEISYVGACEAARNGVYAWFLAGWDNDPNPTIPRIELALMPTSQPIPEITEPWIGLISFDSIGSSIARGWYRAGTDFEEWERIYSLSFGSQNQDIESPYTPNLFNLHRLESLQGDGNSGAKSWGLVEFLRQSGDNVNHEVGDTYNIDGADPMPYFAVGDTALPAHQGATPRYPLLNFTEPLTVTAGGAGAVTVTNTVSNISQRIFQPRERWYVEVVPNWGSGDLVTHHVLHLTGAADNRLVFTGGPPRFQFIVNGVAYPFPIAVFAALDTVGLEINHDAGTLELYVNGVASGSPTAIAADWSAYSGDNIEVGAQGGVLGFDGDLYIPRNGNPVV